MPWKILILAVILTCSLWVYLPNGKLNAYFLNVGQGDSTFIRTPGGYNIIVDGGPDSSLIDSIENIMPPFEHTIDLIVLTHPHADHLWGLIEVIQRYNVKNVSLTGIDHQSSSYGYFIDLIKTKDINTLLPSPNKDIRFNDGVVLDFIYPDSPGLAKIEENINNDSIVIRVIYGQNSLLLSGDAELEEEIKILKSTKDIAASILKAGHHGSRTSSSVNYLLSVSPTYAVISSGINNSYKHPHQETLDSMKKLRISILRTDEIGTIVMLFDQKELFNTDSFNLGA